MDSLFVVEQIEALKKGMSKIEELYRIYFEEHCNYQSLLSQEDKISDDLQSHEINEKVFVFRNRYKEWIQDQFFDEVNSEGSRPKSKASSRVSSKVSRSHLTDLQVPKNETNEVTEKGSGNKRSISTRASSSRSKASSILDLKVREEKAKLAALQVEAKYFEKKKEIELMTLEIKREEEIEKTTARLEALEAHEEQSVNYSWQHTEVDRGELTRSYVCGHFGNDETTVNPMIEDHAEVHQERNGQRKIDTNKDKKVTVHNRVNQNLECNPFTELLYQMQAPDIEIDVFNGNPLEFMYFITSFEQVVESKIKDERGRLTRLLKYLNGDPKELIKSCIYLKKSECYNQAKQMLFDRFGDPHRLLCEFRKEIKLLPRIKANDSIQYKRFFNLLMKFEHTMSYSRNNWYDSPELLQMLQAKLPIHLQDRWARKAWKFRAKHSKEAKLGEFITMIEEEVDLVSDPLYSREAVASSLFKERKGNECENRMKSFLSSANDSICIYCEEDHDLEDC